MSFTKEAKNGRGRKPHRQPTADQACVNEDCEYYKKVGSVIRIGIKKGSGRHPYYQCRDCKKQFSATYGTLFANKKTSEEKIAQVLKALAEGNSIRGASRIFKVSKDTVVKWLKEAGEQCDAVEKILAKSFDFNQVQLDELWTFIIKKTTHSVVRRVK
jgi:transposase-like protein